MVELKLKDTFMTKHQRHNDRHIIDDILTHTSSISSHKKLLACRLYLQTTLLSDITDVKSSFLIPNILLGTRSSNMHHNISWPLQKQSPTVTLRNFGTGPFEVSITARHPLSN